MIVKNVIIIWPGTNASIPSGFTRETALDGRLPKGYGAEAVATNGGATTHTHNSPSHSHTMVNHTHTGNLPQYSGGTEDEGDGSGGNRFADEVHTHTVTSGNVSGGTLTGQATIGTGSNWPPYYEVIYIKATGDQFVPDDAIILRNDTTVPDGFAFCDGTGGTPDLRDKYLKGAETGANGGGTGGALTHSHSYDHGHSAVSHSHETSGSSQATNGQSGTNQDGSGNGASGVHSHSVFWGSVSTSVNAATGTFTSGTVEPLYKTLRANRNTSGGGKLPKAGDIALWLGSPTAVPIGWLLCDGSEGTPDLRNYFVKIGTTPALSGGANTHGHSAVASHTHTATGTHTHTASTSDANDTNMTGVGGHSVSIVNHQHSVTSISSVTATWNSTTIDADSSDNQPPYRTVAYIQFEFTVAGSQLAMML